MQENTPSPKLLRLNQILGKKGDAQKGIPPTPPIIPVCKSSWWLGVKTGRYPQPVRLGKRTVAWRASDILALVEGKEG